VCPTKACKLAACGYDIQMTFDQKISWETKGFVVIEDALSSEEVAKARSAFDLEIEKLRPAWKPPENKPNDRRIHIPDPLDVDDIFVDLADHPKLLPLVRGAIGDDLVLVFVQAFAYPPGEGSFTNWHSDLGHVVGLDHSTCIFLARMIIYLEDVSPDGGCFAYIPGSHKLDMATILRGPWCKETQKRPDYVSFPGKAGTAILFNAYGWHTALPNSGSRERKALQYGYCHGWVQFFGKAAKPKRVEELATTDLRKQLFGIRMPWE